MKKFFLPLILFLAWALPSHAAGSCTITDITSSANVTNRIPDSWTVDVIIACVADASSGSFPSVTIPLTGSTTRGRNAYNLFGTYLYQIGRTPGNSSLCTAARVPFVGCMGAGTGSGLVEPTANYTVTLTDMAGFAVDLGLVTNGSATASQLNAITNTTSGYPKIRSGNLVMAITGNSVASANVRIDLIFKHQTAGL